MEEIDDNCAVELDVVQKAIPRTVSGMSNILADYIGMLYLSTDDTRQVVANTLRFRG